LAHFLFADSLTILFEKFGGFALFLLDASEFGGLVTLGKVILVKI
jgi:hypothetical protein